MALENKWPLFRDVLSFVVGAYGVIMQLQEPTKDPVVLAFCAGLMGVPAMLGLSKKTN